MYYKTGKSYAFQVTSMQIKDLHILLPSCQKPVSAQCEIDCSNEVIMELATVSKLRNNFLGSYQFWVFFMILSLFWISQAIVWTLQDPICFDLLGNL